MGGGGRERGEGNDGDWSEKGNCVLLRITSYAFMSNGCNIRNAEDKRLSIFYKGIPRREFHN